MMQTILFGLELKALLRRNNAHYLKFKFLHFPKFGSIIFPAGIVVLAFHLYGVIFWFICLYFLVMVLGVMSSEYQLIDTSSKSCDSPY